MTRFFAWNIKILSLLASLLLLVLSMGEADAQVRRQAPALQLVSYKAAGGVATYEYQVAGYGRAGELLSDVYLDVTMPRGPRPPVAQALSGTLLFDAIEERYAYGVPYSHPNLQIGTPANWSAAVYLQGVLSWGSLRTERGSNFGVPRGGALRGFTLKSSALPALRRYRVEPERPLAAVGAPEAPVDTTLIIMEGWIVAPGWERDIATGEFLELQVKNACEAVMLDACGRYLRYVDQVREAERRKNDRSYRTALAGMAKAMSEDKVSHQNARFVISSAIQGLAERLPSRR